MGYISDAWGGLKYGVLILPVILLIGAVLWTILIRYTRDPLEIEA